MAVKEVLAASLPPTAPILSRTISARVSVAIVTRSFSRDDARGAAASSIGTPVEPRNVNRRWDELRRRAGLDWLRLHDLRHGCATLLLAKGVPDRVIMEVLGHAEIGVTMNTYAHVLPVLRQEATDAIDELFGA
ncbi:MAG: tyrosine-type recombinase/integrase [Streptosporangiaceae bacterium]